MVNSCCPGNDTAPPAVPAVTVCPSVRNAICLPSSCQSRTWQLVTCQGNHQPSRRQPPHLPDMSCVGFVCQPIDSSAARCLSGAGHSPGLGASPPPSCSDSAGGESKLESKCCDASSCLQSSCQEPACPPGPGQAVGGQSVCHEAKSCPDITSGVDVPCPPVLPAASLCQPSCCQGGSQHPTGGEDQLCCGASCHPLLCYVFEPGRPVPCIPVSCQPWTFVFCSCSPTCWVHAPCQAYHCHLASPVSFICRPAATCRSSCSENSPCKPVSCGPVPSGQPTCDGCTSHSPGRQSPSWKPACCVTGSGKASSCGFSHL
ncbi:keratin-associated protein 29-1 [Cavia porcellus]|uniref:keratin-associated protein 29-1 n=1 Tax=Cavia porcellus TaxID=10141 RepID=UPI002FE3EF20